MNSHTNYTKYLTNLPLSVMSITLANRSLKTAIDRVMLSWQRNIASESMIVLVAIGISNLTAFR